MSWSKFNDSLNSLKGQLTTFIQENVVPEDDAEGPGTDTESAEVNLDQLSSVCAAQENEIIVLRRQVAELRQQTTKQPQQQQLGQNASAEGGGSETAGQPPANSQTLEDSWFWEADKNSSSSASSTKTGGGSGSGSGAGESDLTIIPLTEPESAAGTSERVKKLTLENAVLREKNKQLQAEVRETNENIEELDKQHNLIMETVMEQKRTLQDKLNGLTEEHDKLAMKFKQMAEAKDTRIMEMTQATEELQEKFSELKQANVALRNKVPEEPFVDVVEVEKDVQLQAELERLRVEKRKIEEDFVAGQEDYLMVQRELAEYKTQFNEEKMKECVSKQELEEILKLENSNKPHDPVLTELFAIVQRHQSDCAAIENLEQELAQVKAKMLQAVDEKKRICREKETLQADLINYEIECGELLKNNEKLLEELEQTKCGKLETIPEHSEESFTVLEKEYGDLSGRCSELSEEVKELKKDRGRLEDTIQQLEFQLNELRSSTDNEKDDEDELKELELKQREELKAANQQVAELQVKLNESKEAAQLQCKQVADLENDLAIAQERLQSQTLALENRQLDEDAQLQERNEELLMKQQKLHDEIAKYSSSVQQLTEERADMERTIVALQAQVATLDEQLNAAIRKCGDDESATIAELKLAMEKQSQEAVARSNETLAQWTQEKNELIALVTNKHQESVQYHAEVQRLGALLQQEVQKAQQVVECGKCGELREELQQKVVRLDELQRQETDQLHFLKEKTSILTSNLLVEQNLKKMLQKEKEDMERDSERLRQHLMALEEEHTQQLMEMQRQMEEYKAKSTTLESEAKHASTAYTSANIRANQQNETLQAQYKLLQQQRDDLSEKLSQAEDNQSKNAAALINLQCALEQFQREKQRDVENALYLVRKEVAEEKQKFVNLMGELQATQVQLNDAKTGLLAAARISDQLEGSQRLIADQKEEIRNLEVKSAKLEEKIRQADESHSDKVEKGLIKNLVIGYLTAPNNGKGQILKLISAVLEFDQAEADRAGVNKSQSGWLGGLLQQHSSASDNSGNEGLAQAFVKFLEQESRPQETTTTAPALLTMMNNPNVTSQTTTLATTSATTKPFPGNLTGSVLTQSTMVASADAALQNSFVPVPTRNSSSILKDVLSDS